MEPQIAPPAAMTQDGALTRFHVRLLVLAVLLLVTDGYDTQAIGYVAPVLTGVWHLGRGSFGPVFSAGLLGLMLGAMALTPLADRIGARRVLLGCICAYATLTLTTAFAPSRASLLWLRFFTGLGLGGAMPSAIALVASHAPVRRRSLMVAVTVCGFSLGGALGGAVAAAIIARFGWQSVFIVGAAIPLLTLPALFAWLPESPPPSAAATTTPAFPVRLLFAQGHAAPTLLIWTAFFCNLLLLYFLANWLPSVVHASGVSVAAANLTTAVYQGSGTLGALVLAAVADRTRRAQQVLAGAFLGAAVCIVLLGAGTAVPALMAGAAGAGFCVIGGQIAANAFTAAHYPAAMRATGVGWALGMGRFGSIFGPLIGGVLIGLDVPMPTLFRLFAAPALLATVCILLVRPPRPAARLADEPAGP
jgi:AAHS family 4-hydroxybenzoate transporter-like MFS transporter